jgi:hypothetical protein
VPPRCERRVRLGREGMTTGERERNSFAIEAVVQQVSISPFARIILSALCKKLDVSNPHHSLDFFPPHLE